MSDQVEGLARQRLKHRGDWLLLPAGERQRVLNEARRDLMECEPFIRKQRDEELRERLEKLPRFEPGQAGGLSSTELSGRLIIRAEACSIFEEAEHE